MKKICPVLVWKKKYIAWLVAVTLLAASLPAGSARAEESAPGSAAGSVPEASESSAASENSEVPEASRESAPDPAAGSVPEASESSEASENSEVPEASRESTPGPAAGSAPESSEASESPEASENSEASRESAPGYVTSRGPEDLDEETARWLDSAGEALSALAAEREIMALVYLTEQYEVKSLPSAGSDTTVTVQSGHQVNILDVCLGEDYEVWAYVRLEYDGMERFGYVQRSYLAVSDARFLSWEEAYGLGSGATYAAEDGSHPDIEQFPVSYQAALRELKAKHPNWTFVKMNTTLDWDTTIRNELKDGRSLVYKTFPDWAKNGLYDTGNWYYATEAVLKVYMDPRNALTENAIFQFEQLTYNEEYHTLEAMRKFLDNTFMNGSKPAPGMDTLTYAELFWYMGKHEDRNVSPFHLAARVLQEQGQGKSPLISGTYPGYEGYYNYFNIGATGTTNQAVIESGLAYAKKAGWDSVYMSLWGGAGFISGNYIKKGQDTLYLQKFNVNPNGTYAPYTHQYMQNISAPTSEALSIKKLYANANSLDSTFVFKIPVYENMPAKACTEPGKEPEEPDEPIVETLDFTLELPEGYTDTVLWLDGVAREGTKTGNRLTVTAADNAARMAVAYRYDASGVPVGMYVWSLRYEQGAYKATPEPGLEDLLTYHGFAIRITGKTGIRFKTGISIDVRNQLLTTGINGYRLKEYGTLVMSDANRDQYPMVKGGAKVKSGLSYGTDSSGNHKDVVFESVNGRYRYTSVLVGIPAEQYKTKFAFRGYIVLEKDGSPVTLYGPIMARSIYVQAERYLANQTYQPGTAPYEFLRKLIDDADAIESREETP